MSETVDDQQQILQSLWSPHPGQRSVMESDARFRIVSAGRRWGKSEMCGHLALEYALSAPHSTVWWIAPSYDQANEYGFDTIVRLLSTEILEDTKRTKPRKIWLSNGSELSFRSADREDSLRGGGVDFLVIDEAGSVPERAWTEELRPTLSDTQGDMVAIGTPKGRNWFWRWFQRGQSVDHDDVRSFQAPTKQNPHVPDSEVDSARVDVPDRVFEQEYNATFVDDSGGVFTDIRQRNVRDYALPVSPERSDEPYSIGVDFARMSDWTVATVLDSTGRLVACERLQQTTWTRIQSIVERLADAYTPSRVALDATRDNKIVSDLRDAGVSTKPVQFTSKSKRMIIENLITELEMEEIVISADANQLINELEVFEYDTTPSGNVRYNAPSGFHDDCVDSLALAAHEQESKVTITRRTPSAPTKKNIIPGKRDDPFEGDSRLKRTR